ncbi:polyunsaturated fatty acid lipoxygenase ALOX15B-like [Columba livia]|uniref:polyunsaturated fatty acid lipoxygenase ALOX15B-like n=1 Tax=Columba livia TaxID=8932 RepID=UPI0031B9EE0D
MVQSRKEPAPGSKRPLIGQQELAPPPKVEADWECPKDFEGPRSSPRTQECPKDHKGPRSAPEDPGVPQEPRNSPEGPRSAPETQECPKGPRSTPGTQEFPRRTQEYPRNPGVPWEPRSTPEGPRSAPGTQEYPRRTQECPRNPGVPQKDPGVPQEPRSSPEGPRSTPGTQEFPGNPGVPQKDPGVPQEPRSSPETQKCPKGPRSSPGTQEYPRNPGVTQKCPKGPRSSPGTQQFPRNPGVPQKDPGVPQEPSSSPGTQEYPRRTLASPSPPAVPSGTPSPAGDPDVPKGTQASGEGPVRYRLRTLVASVTSPCPLGPLLLLRVHTEPLVSLVPDRWLLERVTVTGPLGDNGDNGGIGVIGVIGDMGGNEDIGGSGDIGGNGGIGDIGGIGDTGIIEVTEDTGDTGNTGGIGDIGDIGGTGDTGNTGGIGDIGDIGGTGDTGNTGGIGDIGNTGDTNDTIGDTDGDTGATTGGTGNAGDNGDTNDTDGDTGDTIGDTNDTIGDTNDTIGDTGATTGDTGATSDVPSATFPCHRWLGSGCTDLHEGTARTPLEAARVPQLLQLRQEEQEERREAFQFAPYAPCWPWRLRALRPALCPWPRPPPAPVSPVWPQLPPSLAFPIGHRINIIARAAAAQLRFRRCGASWKSFEELHAALGKPGTPIAEYVLQHWRDDAFFGAQYLSGVNPVLLRRCHRLPPNFPVTPHMVAPSLGPHTSLQREMEGGRLFLADYAMLRGVYTRPLGGAPQSVAPAICLLWLNPQGELRPIAIQLSQDPGVPIFTPQDAPWCWALAKLWVRGAHFTQHELVTHLLSTHFLAETFAVATQRLPAAHPIHQLLLPHFRFTFHINILARESLLNPGGIIDQATAVGREGTLELVARGTAALTYRELCVPEDIEDRGVALVPNYYYRDDALEIWAAMESLVEGVVSLHYAGDKEVAEDEELQSWVGDIFTYAVLGNQQSGFPSKLLTRPELVKFTTMIMFCCSARHSAVNSGQYDFAAWMPNTPGTLQGDPPVTKAEATEQRFLGTLPSPAATGALLALLSVVSYEGGQPRPLGSRCPELLVGAAAQRLIGQFRRRLAAISRRIGDRNRRLELPYPYLDPPRVTESVAI